MILFWSLMFIAFCAINFLVIWLDDICPTEYTLKLKYKLTLMSAVSNVNFICDQIKRNQGLYIQRCGRAIRKSFIKDIKNSYKGPSVPEPVLLGVDFVARCNRSKQS